MANTKPSSSFLNIESGTRTLITRSTPSGASSVELTGFNASLYDGYEIICHLSFASASGDLYMRVSDDGGATYESATSYKYKQIYGNNSNTTVSGNNSTGAAQLLINAEGTYGTGVGNKYTSRIRFMRPDETTKFVVSAEIAHMNTSQQSNITVMAGNYETEIAIDAVQLFPASGNFTGTILFYGIKKA